MRAAIVYLTLVFVCVFADYGENDLETVLLEKLILDLEQRQAGSNFNPTVEYDLQLGFCKQNGNTYRPVAGNCGSFTQETALLPPKTHNCPKGLVFDLVTCVCNYPVVARCGNQQGGGGSNSGSGGSNSGSGTGKPNPGGGSGTEVGNAVVYGPSSGSCKRNGCTYRPLPNTRCNEYTQESPGYPLQKLKCQEGFEFDTVLCTCNYPLVTRCCDGKDVDDKAVVPNPNPTYDLGFCQQNGNTYRPLPNTNCAKFSQETALLPPKVHNCPDGLQFDIVACVCNWPRATKCGQTQNGGVIPIPQPNGRGNEPSGNAVVYPNPLPAGSCYQNGNTYTPVPRSNCARFTQATAFLPPKELSCPRGLMFDTSTCVCNWPFFTTCPN